MSENGNDNKNFEFIKEQVIIKKRKKLKKLLLPLITTALMAILFGLIAAITFVIAEPRFDKLLSKDEEGNVPISFPTKYPDDTQENSSLGTVTEGNMKQDDGYTQQGIKSDSVVVEKSIEANIKDFINMNDKIRTIAYETEKSLVNISSIIIGKDIFKNTVERTVKTTGLVIAEHSEDLLILVSLDRVKDASSIKVVFSDTVSVDAILHSYEKELNLAVIAIHQKDIPDIHKRSIEICDFGESYSITVGSPIIALGSPNGHPKSLEQGIITSRGGSIGITDNRLELFNTNITNNKNSDGIIVNLRGEIIGIITRTLKEDINEGLSTAIGISKLKIIIQRLANKEPIIYFGIKAEEMTEAAKKEHNVDHGIYVSEIKMNSPAMKAGLKNGDIILQINEQDIVNMYNFYSTILGHRPGEDIVVKVKRSTGTTEKEMEFKVTLVEKEQ